MNGYIAWLDGSEQHGAHIAGGKGASLARLAAAGFPVPPGFAVTVAAYRDFHSHHGLDLLAAPLEELSGRPPLAAVRDAVAPLHARLSESTMPDALREAIVLAYGDLEVRAGEGSTFAVRSSGASEDGKAASFAGLYDSYLNIAGEEAILRAVQDCYTCLWQPRAVHYRTIKGIGHRNEAMATVVMQTVNSRTSGVAFTRHPVTGDDNEVLINASWGLGEAIVSGLVTPDNYAIRKDGTVTARELGLKEKRVVPAAGGTAEEPVPAEDVERSSLSDDELAQVLEAAIAVERHYEMPMDIEFAFDHGGHFYLLQARPITTHWPGARRSRGVRR